MSVRASAWVWEHPNLKPHQKLVLLALADYASHDGSSIYPSVGTIARRTSYTERRVQQIFRELEAMHLLEQEGTHTLGRADRVVNVYRLKMESELGQERGEIISPRPAPRGEISDTDGVKPASPNPLEVDTRQVKNQRACAREVPHLLPADLDDPGRTTYADAVRSLPTPPTKLLDAKSWAAWCYYVRYRKRTGKPLTERAAGMTFTRAVEEGCTGPADFALGLDAAEERGWTAAYWSGSVLKRGTNGNYGKSMEGGSSRYRSLN